MDVLLHKYTAYLTIEFFNDKGYNKFKSISKDIEKFSYVTRDTHKISFDLHFKEVDQCTKAMVYYCKEFNLKYMVLDHRPEIILNLL